MTRTATPVRSLRTFVSPKRPNALGLEALETRVNLSATPVHVAVPTDSLLRTVETRRLTAAAPIHLDGLIGASALAASGTTAVPVTSYSSIFNCQLEYRNGQPDIGWVNPSGAYVEYQVTAPAAGAYTLSLGMGGLVNAQTQITVNGNWVNNLSVPATGSWDVYKTLTQTVNLAAGTNTIRIAAIGGTQYNLNAVSLTGNAGYAVSQTGATTVPVTGYAAIANAMIEYQGSTPDIGYVNPNGSYVDYVLSVPVSGSYNLSLGLAAAAKAGLNVYSNGQLTNTFDIPATGGWTSYTTLTKSVYLSAGQTTLRFANVVGTGYNINAITLTPPSTLPTPTTSTPTPTPAPNNPVSVWTTWMNSFTQINVAGTSGNDNILVTQSGSTLYVTANGQTTSYTGNYGNLVIHGGAGDDTITVDSSVWVPTLMYGDGGTNTLTNKTNAKATIVSIGNGADTVTGNGANTSYWVDQWTDTVYASSAEWAAGRVHQVRAFWGNVSTSLAGQDLTDPAGTGSTVRLTNRSLWGTGPADADVLQGQNSTCYLFASLAGLARYSPDRLMETAVDLGDGTYAVQFVRNGIKSYVRVDGDLPAGGPYANGLMYGHPGASGDLWAPIIEKAYAVYRTNSWSYNSINYGVPTAALSDLGIVNAVYYPGTDANAAYNTISAALASGRAVVFGTNPTIVGGAPLVGAHGYTVIGANRDAWGNVTFTLRNPWGFDGAGWDANTQDGIVTITFAQMAANNYASAIVS